MTFQDILNKYGIEFRQSGEHHHAREGWIQLDCPFCSRDWKHFRMGYNLYGGYVACWSCGFHPLAETVQLLTEEPWKTVKDLIEGLTKDIAPPEFEIRGKYEEPSGVCRLLRQHKDYLRSRGFSPRKISKLWGVRGIGKLGRYPWRLFIPIIHRGTEVSWTTRSVGETALRYVSAGPSEERYSHKLLLYGEDYCKNAVVICEGPLDVWKVGPGAVATCGTGFSRSQVLRLSKYPKRAVCLDSTKEGQIMAKKMVRQLSAFPGETLNIELDSKDPGEATERELKQVRKLLT